MRPGRKRRQTFDLRTEREICGLREEGNWEKYSENENIWSEREKGGEKILLAPGRRPRVFHLSPHHSSQGSRWGGQASWHQLWKQNVVIFESSIPYVLSLWPDNYGHTSHGSGEDDFGEVPHFCFNCLQRGPLIEVKSLNVKHLTRGSPWVGVSQSCQAS